MQEKFTLDAVARFGLEDMHCPVIPTPTSVVFEELDESCLLDKAEQKVYMEKVGTLNYLTTQTRADVSWAVSKLGMYMQQADAHVMKICDRVYAYLHGTADTTTVFRRQANGLTIIAYSDASHADAGKCRNGRRRSQSGCCILMCGAAIQYHSRGQESICKSTVEVEYMYLES